MNRHCVDKALALALLLALQYILSIANAATFTEDPPLKDIRAVSQTVARDAGLQAIKDGLAEVDDAGLKKELAANFWEPVYEPYEFDGADPDASGVRKTVGKVVRRALRPTLSRRPRSATPGGR